MRVKCCPLYILRQMGHIAVYSKWYLLSFCMHFMDACTGLEQAEKIGLSCSGVFSIKNTLYVINSTYSCYDLCVLMNSALHLLSLPFNTSHTDWGWHKTEQSNEVTTPSVWKTIIWAITQAMQINNRTRWTSSIRIWVLLTGKHEKYFMSTANRWWTTGIMSKNTSCQIGTETGMFYCVQSCPRRWLEFSLMRND